jgi:putative oxidoreductase
MPFILATLVILAEFIGSIGVLLGLGTRFMAFPILLTMSGAAVLGGHIHNGFFMNWFGMQKGEGIEFFILAVGLALALLIGGSGKCSIDNLISKKLK